MNLKSYLDQPWDKVKSDFNNYTVFSDETYPARHAEPCTAYTAFKDGKEFLIMVNKRSEDVDVIKDIDLEKSEVSTRVKAH